MGRKFPLIAVLLLPIALSVFAWDTSPTGRWITFDEETGVPKSLVEIHEREGTLEGSVVRILTTVGVAIPTCRFCTGARRDQPIVGLTIIEGMRRDGNVWSGGDILDPENGKSYACRMTLSHDGSELEVRGFIGIPLLGRTQIWKRETK